MTLVADNNRQLFPGLGFAMRMGASPSLATRTTLAAIGHYAAQLFGAEKAFSIGALGGRLGVLSGTGLQVEWRVEQVNAGANWDQPSGTLWATNTLRPAFAPTSNAWNAPAATTAAASIAMGDEFWIKLLITAGTTPSLVVQRFSGPNGNGSNSPFGYDLIATGSIITNVQLPWFIGSDVNTPILVNGAWPITAISNLTFNTSGGAAARALKISGIPFSGRAIGIVCGSLGTNTGDFYGRLWAGAGASPSQVASSKLKEGNRFAKSAAGPAVVWFDAYYDFAQGDTLYVGAQANEATSIQCSSIQVPGGTSAMLAGFPHGTICSFATLAGTTWTAEADKIADFDLIYIPHDGAGGAGGGGSIFTTGGGIIQ